MNDEEEQEGDRSLIDAAANFRRFLREEATKSFDPMIQSLFDMEQLAEDAGIELDYDPDFDDIRRDW